MDRLEFEAELRREGYRVVNSSLKPNMVDPNHCHDFDAKLLVLGGEITITRDNTPEAFRAGQSCEVPAGCMHAEHVGPEGVAYVAGRRCKRRAAHARGVRERSASGRLRGRAWRPESRSD